MTNSKYWKPKEITMNTKMGSQGDRKETIMNTRSLIRKTSVMILLAMVLTVALTVGTASDASANHMSGYNDGQGCTWWHLDAGWIGQCYRATTSTSGYIWGYFGTLKNPWILAGQYDAYHNYYYDYAGGFLSRVERSTGLTTYPSACGWITANTTCLAGTTSAPSYGIVGGGTYPSNPWIAQTLLDINDTWLAPNCTASYNGC
jgi:hypothetical protein